MVVELLTSQLLRCVEVIRQVTSHATKRCLLLRAVTALRFTGHNVARWDNDFTILISVIFLDLLVVSKMVERCVMAQPHVLSRTKRPVVLSNRRQLLAIAEEVLARVNVRLACAEKRVVRL